MKTNRKISLLRGKYEEKINLEIQNAEIKKKRPNTE